jgi:uncharacterized protein (DUF1697 family)
MRYLALLRGINVGGNNLIAMADLRAWFEEAGATHVATYIQSGNVLFEGGRMSADAWSNAAEAGLSSRFGYAARVVVRSEPELRAIVDEAPPDFGISPDEYRYDAIFLRPPLRAAEAIEQVPTRAGVDVVVAGDGVLYFSRLVANVTQSQISRLVGTPIYKEMTIRNWRTTTALLRLLDERSSD